MPISRHSALCIAIRLALVGLLPSAAWCAAPEATPESTPVAASKPAVSPEAASHAVGLMLGEQLHHNGMDSVLSVEAVVSGLRDGIGGKPTSTEDREVALKFMRTTRDALADRNRTAAQEYLAKNAAQPGVTSMPSGLQYRILAAGDPSGVSPRPTDQVTVRYVASLADGTVFDRSETHDRPAKFQVNSVFKGWQEAFAAMTPGAIWQLFVPPDLGYGANSPPPVPPGALLVYELELVRVEPGEPAAMKHRAPPAAKGEVPAQAPR